MDKTTQRFKIIADLSSTGMTQQELEEAYSFVYDYYLQSLQIVRHWVPDQIALMLGGDNPVALIRLAPRDPKDPNRPTPDELVFQGNQILWPWDDEIPYAQVKLLYEGYLLIIHKL